MKKITLIVGLFTFTSCESVQDIISPATPDATFSLTKQNRGLVVANNLSTNFETCVIDWGDGQSDNCTGGQIPNHVYESDGNYSIVLTAKSKNGKKTDIETKSIKIDNTEGDFTVYLARVVNEPMVSFYVDNKKVFNATKISTYSGILECTDILGESGIKLKLKPGQYKFSAVSVPKGNTTWSFEFTVKNDKCTVKKLG